METKLSDIEIPYDTSYRNHIAFKCCERIFEFVLFLSKFAKKSKILCHDIDTQTIYHIVFEYMHIKTYLIHNK